LGVTLRRIIFSVAAASFVQSADAGPIDDKVFAEFESLCLDNMNEIGRASFFADATGWLKIAAPSPRPFWTDTPVVFGSSKKPIRDTRSF
jgi:hypothetical protein